MDRIGVIGLGRMGSAIAKRMKGEGRTVLGWTRSGRTAEGVESTADLATLVDGSDVLILSLFDDSAVQTMLDALLELPLDGKLIIETSTVVPELLRERIARIESAGARAVDAPISGGPELVAAGSCGIFLGGEAHDARAAQTALAPISSRMFHVGPLGAGLVMKTINNGVIGLYLGALYQFMPLAARAGIDLDTAIAIVAGGPGGTPLLKDRLPRIRGEDDSVGFAINDIAKDADIFRRVVEAHDLSAPMTNVLESYLAEMRAAGVGDQDAGRIVNAGFARGVT